MKESDASRLPDADMRAAPRALGRASERASEIARRSGTPLIVVRAGVLMELDPETDEQSVPPHDVIHDKE